MPGRFLSVVFGGHAARASNTPRALEGQGKKAARGRPVGSPKLANPKNSPKTGGMYKGQGL